MPEQYQQSQTIEQIQAKHPFPWREQRSGPLIRMVDAKGIEVVLFEMTALCRIVTRSQATAQS